MSRQWLDIYQKGPSVFSNYILSYKPDQQQTQRFNSQKKLLDEQITEKYKQSTLNQQYRFPKRTIQTEESHHSMVSVLEYDLHEQNPTFCSFRRCLRGGENNRSERSGRDRSLDGGMKRAGSRKILGLGKVKQIKKKSLSKSKRKRKIEVRQIHLSSSGQENQDKRSPLVDSNKASRKFIRGVRRKNKNTNVEKQQGYHSIVVINRPKQDTQNSPRPFHASTLQQQSSCCHENPCQTLTNPSLQRKNIRYMTNRPAPNIRKLIVEKREIKIITSQQFNNRRSRDKTPKLPRDTLSSKKTLEDTKRTLWTKN